MNISKFSTPLHAHVAPFNQLKLDPPEKLRKVHPDVHFPMYVFTLSNCENNESTQITYAAAVLVQELNWR